MTDNVKITFSTERIKYIVYENIKNLVFENKGIVYGGFVRDFIICDHYKRLYNQTNSYNTSAFWNKLIHPETAPRTIVANDIDVCMYSDDDVLKFIADLQNLFCLDAGFDNITSSNIVVDNTMKYFGAPITTHRKIKYKIIVGKIPYVFCGVELSFDIDIIIPKNSNNQPPFYKTDLLSNIFLMNKEGIVISKNTGTIIDRMSLLDKQKITHLIMKDIVEFKTQFAIRDKCYFDYNSGSFLYNCEVYHRIHKMMFRTFKWNITNLPFEICDFQANNSTTICGICLSNFKKKNKIIKMYNDNSTKTEKVCSMVHDYCLFKYFETQIETSKNNKMNSTDEFEFRCPMRNIINFKLHSDNITETINNKMNE